MQLSKFRVVLFYSLMVCLLIPIGALAFWAKENARPNNVTSRFTTFGDRNVVLGHNPYSVRVNQFYWTDLDSGVTLTRTYHPMLHTFSRNWLGSKVWILGEKSKDQFVVQIADLANSLTPEMHEINMASRIELVAGTGMIDGRLIRLRSDTLESIDFLTGEVMDTFVLPSKNLFHLNVIQGTNQFTVEGDKNVHTGAQDIFLFDATGGIFRQIARSNSKLLHAKIGDNTYTAILLVDGATIEVRNTRSGAIVSTYSVPEDALQPTSIVSLETPTDQKSWIRWQSSPSVCTDILTGQTLPIPLGSDLLDQDFHNHRLITIRKKGQGTQGWECVLLDKTDGKELSRFDVQKEHYQSNSERSNRFGEWSLVGGNQLALTTRDHRIFVYDLTTGKLVRNLDPFFLSDWCSRCVVAAYSLWCLVWLLLSARCHPHGWLDLFICSGLVLAFDAKLYDSDRSVFISVFSSWLLVATTWLIFGKTRWSLRFQLLFLLVVIIVGFMNHTPTAWNLRLSALSLPGILTLILTVVIALTPLKWLRFRIERELEPKPIQEEHVKQPSQTITLRDLFCWTITFAILFSIFRTAPDFGWNSNFSRSWDRICMMDVWIAGTGLFAMWVALSPRSWKLPWGIALIAMLGLVVMANYLFGDKFLTKVALPTVLATLLGFFAYRLRGWRLVRHG